MGTIHDYTDGTVLEDIAKALHVFRKNDGSLANTDIGQRMLGNIKKFEPVIITMDQAMDSIHNASSVAIGERVCRTLHPDSVFTESVFLDELAEEMIQKGVATSCTADEAKQTLSKYSKHPLIISKVSGKHQEICRTHPPECVYWIAEKKGLTCLARIKAENQSLPAGTQ